MIKLLTNQKTLTTCDSRRDLKSGVEEDETWMGGGMK